MRAICSGKHRLPSGSLPWKWGPFWANVVKMGSENSERFGAGLLSSAGVEGDELKISEQQRAIENWHFVMYMFHGSLRVLDLSDNLYFDQLVFPLAEGLKGNSTLESLKYRPFSARTSATACSCVRYCVIAPCHACSLTIRISPLTWQSFWQRLGGRQCLCGCYHPQRDDKDHQTQVCCLPMHSLSCQRPLTLLLLPVAAWPTTSSAGGIYLARATLNTRVSPSCSRRSRGAA